MFQVRGKKESVQKAVQKVQSARSLTYGDEIGDVPSSQAFVVGVLGDFRRSREQDQGQVRDRKFVNVDMDGADDVIAGMAPRAAYRVKVIAWPAGSGELGVDIEFKLRISVPSPWFNKWSRCCQLQEARAKLADLRNARKLAGNETERPAQRRAEQCRTVAKPGWQEKRRRTPVSLQAAYG